MDAWTNSDRLSNEGEMDEVADEYNRLSHKSSANYSSLTCTHRHPRRKEFTSTHIVAEADSSQFPASSVAV